MCVCVHMCMHVGGGTDVLYTSIVLASIFTNVSALLFFQAGDHDLRHCSLEKSAEILKTLDGDVTFVVQYNPGSK